MFLKKNLKIHTDRFADGYSPSAFHKEWWKCTLTDDFADGQSSPAFHREWWKCTLTDDVADG